MTLDSLSDRELNLYNDVILFEGSIESKIQQLEASGIIEQYKEIHKSYFELVLSSPNDDVKLEALKRVIFMNWYGNLEPAWLTGIANLDRDTIYNSYTVFNDYIKQGKLDPEFNCMLSYYSTWDYLIVGDNNDEHPELIAFIQNVDHSQLHISNSALSEQPMNNRGQMGLYFQEMCNLWTRDKN